MSRTVKRPARPYLGDRSQDANALVSTQLLTELWIVKDRLAVLERILEERGLISRESISEYVPSGDFARELDRERDAFVARVAGAPFNDDADVESLRRDADIG